jgi:hypothetical protein
MAAPPKSQVIAEGKKALELFEDEAYADDEKTLAELSKLLETVRTGALAISAERKDKRLPDEYGKLAHTMLPLQPALDEYENKGTPVPAKLIEAFSGALEDAEKSRG